MNNNQNEEIQVRRKQKKFSYFYFVLQGIISLLGYNAILCSLDYFASKFQQYNIYFYLPLPPMVTFNLVSIIMPNIAQKIQYITRIYICIIGMISILILLPLSSNYLSQTPQGFAVVMFLSFIWGIFGQVFNSSLIGLSCMVDRNQVIAYNIGSSAGGVIIVLIRMLVVTFLDDDINLSTLIYFISAGFINLVGLISHFIYVRSRAYIKFRRNNKMSLIYQQEEVLINRSRQNSKVHHQNDVQTQLYTSKQVENDSNIENAIQEEVNFEQQIKEQFESIRSNNNPLEPTAKNQGYQEQLIDLSLLTFEELTMKQQFVQYFGIAKYLMPLPIFMLLSNICANMMYPALSLKSSLSHVDYTWSCIWIVFMHNLSNVIGKYLTVFRILYNSCFVNTLVILRFLHFIIFIMNAVNKNSIFYHDWIICLNIIVFSLSAGFTDGGLFILSSEKMCTNLHREQGGFVMAFSLTFGIMLGIFLAMPFQNI